MIKFMRLWRGVGAPRLAKMITDKLPPVVYVNSKMLPTKVGKLVRIIGRVDQVSSDGLRAQIEASDKGTILVNRVHGANPYGTHYVCITGTVGQDLSITENAFENLGNSFDATNFNRLVEFMPKSPALFAC